MFFFKGNLQKLWRRRTWHVLKLIFKGITCRWNIILMKHYLSPLTTKVIYVNKKWNLVACLDFRIITPFFLDNLYECILTTALLLFIYISERSKQRGWRFFKWKQAQLCIWLNKKFTVVTKMSFLKNIFHTFKIRMS